MIIRMTNPLRTILMLMLMMTSTMIAMTLYQLHCHLENTLDKVLTTPTSKK
jgi:hypothetical protein